jgi:adenylyltransferase/sulfurtransferase
MTQAVIRKETPAPRWPGLSREELIRYDRHLTLPEVGVEGQIRLKRSRVLIVGAGGLGSPLALYLAAAGVGHLGLVDFDAVDLSNLQRQILHGTSDVGRSKLASARRRLTDVNPHVRLQSYETRFTAANAREILDGYHLIVDGTDNFGTRFLVNDASVLFGVPNVYGSIFRFEGQASVFGTPDGPCYRCLFRAPPPPGLVPNCAEGGVLGVLPGLVGTVQATEAIKLLLGIGRPLIGRLLLIDALTMGFRTVRVHRDPACPACGTREIRELVDEHYACDVPLPPLPADGEIAPAELAARLHRGEDVLLLDVREPHEWEISRLPSARLVPLGVLGDALGSLPRDRDIVVYCKGGVRGAKAVAELRGAGFQRVRNLTGGITAWSREA